MTNQQRIRITEEERALLARKAQAIERKALLELRTIGSPDTSMRWQPLGGMLNCYDRVAA